MCTIIPAVLAKDEHDFRRRIMHPGLRRVAPTWHIDILDGTMFNATCFADAEVIGTWRDLPEIEIHVMSHNPLPHIEAWRAHVPTLRRAIIHAEIARPLGAIVERVPEIRFSLALNPETDVIVPHAHYHLFDRVLIMGVHPGASGQPFLGEPIFAKIRRLAARYPQFAAQNAIDVDGGVSLTNAPQLHDAGASRLVTSSALWAAADPVEAYDALRGHEETAWSLRDQIA